MMDAQFRWGIDDIRDIERWDRRLVVRDVATLPDIARLFGSRVPLSHRLAGALVERTMPGFARAYRLSRIAVSGPGERRS